MPLFDIRGTEHALPVATTQLDDASFAAAARSVVSEHLSTLLGEQMITVAETPRSTADLLALDSSGRPVVVQIMPRLTAQGLLEALDVAGRASRLTRGDLAATYPDGPDRFHATLRAFFDSVPVARHEAPTPGIVRLVIVCAEVDAALGPGVDFLRSGSPRIDLLHVGLIPDHHGHRLVDVSPMAGTSGSAPASRGAVAPEVRAAWRAVEHALTGAVPVVRREDAQPAGHPRTAFGSVAPVGASAPLPQLVLPEEPSSYVPVFLDLPERLSALPGRPGGLPTPDLDDGEVSPNMDLLAPPRDPASVVGPTDPALAQLARDLHEPLVLVWLRHRRGERFEVVLHPDGSLHTEGGVRYADPTWAASAVSGGTASDGWRVWRVGDHGRTLAELRA